MNRKSLVKLIVLVIVIIAVLTVGTILYRMFAAPSYADGTIAQEKPEVVEAEGSSGTGNTGDPGSDADPAQTSNGTPATDFAVYDMEGNTVQLSDHFGTPVIVNFWATWCPPCRGELPDFQEMYEQYGEQVTFLMVDLTTSEDGGQKDVQTFLTQNGFTFPVLLDLDGNAAAAYAVNAIPETLVIDADGMIRSMYYGAIDGAILEEQIGIILQ